MAAERTFLKGNTQLDQQHVAPGQVLRSEQFRRAVAVLHDGRGRKEQFALLARTELGIVAHEVGQIGTTGLAEQGDRLAEHVAAE